MPQKREVIIHREPKEILEPLRLSFDPNKILWEGNILDWERISNNPSLNVQIYFTEFDHVPRSPSFNYETRSRLQVGGYGISYQSPNKLVVFGGLGYEGWLLPPNPMGDDSPVYFKPGRRPSALILPSEPRLLVLNNAALAPPKLESQPRRILPKRGPVVLQVRLVNP